MHACVHPPLHALDIQLCPSSTDSKGEWVDSRTTIGPPRPSCTSKLQMKQAAVERRVEQGLQTIIIDVPPDGWEVFIVYGSTSQLSQISAMFPVSLAQGVDALRPAEWSDRCDCAGTYLTVRGAEGGNDHRYIIQGSESKRKVGLLCPTCETTSKASVKHPVKHCTLSITRYFLWPPYRRCRYTHVLKPKTSSP